VVLALVALLFVANTTNIGADLSAMDAPTKLVAGGSQHLYTVLVALAALLGTVRLQLTRCTECEQTENATRAGDSGKRMHPRPVGRHQTRAGCTVPRCRRREATPADARLSPDRAIRSAAN
jgi:hypothetical protein